MTRPFIVILVFINIATIGIALSCSHLYHAHHRMPPAPDEFEHRLSERLSEITTPAQMQTASADLTRMVGSGHRAILGSVALVDQLVGYLELSSALNIAVIAVGVWQKRRQTQQNSSNKAQQPTAGRRDAPIDGDDRSNQSLEPTAGRCNEKVEGQEMIVESRSKLAPASGGSACSR